MRKRATVVTWITVVAVFLSAGCSVRYGPRIPGFQPGYEQEQLGERTYQIRVGEAWPRDRPVIGKIALYRAAEIATEKGFQFFSVLSSSDHETNYTIYTPGTSTSATRGSFVGGMFNATTTTLTTPGSAVPIQGNWTFLDVRLLAKDEIGGASNVIDAQKVIDDLKYLIDRRR